MTTITWNQAEDAILNYVQTQWALSAYSTVPLVFENATVDDSWSTYIFVDIQGTFSEKSPYDDADSRLYLEYGIVYYHCFFPSGRGKGAGLAPVVAIGRLLELQTVADVIKFDGCNPPSPAEQSDNLVPDRQPGGNFYRVSGSVSFFVIGN